MNDDNTDIEIAIPAHRSLSIRTTGTITNDGGEILTAKDGQTRGGIATGIGLALLLLEGSANTSSGKETSHLAEDQMAALVGRNPAGGMLMIATTTESLLLATIPTKMAPRTHTETGKRMPNPTYLIDHDLLQWISPRDPRIHAPQCLLPHHLHPTLNLNRSNNSARRG